MELNPIGKHCALQSCNVFDFLPIQCSCLEWFCKLHISPNLHDCASVQQQPLKSPSTASMRPSCAFLGCDKPSLATSVTTVGLSDPVQSGCPGCQFSFCVDHRHMPSHSCTGLATRNSHTKHEVARAVFSKKFRTPSTQTSRTPVVVRQQRSLPPDSQRLAQLQKVNLMKLRHKAIPADSKDRNSVVPIDQRLYVTVRLETIGHPAKEIAVWFRKTTVTGKALDLVVQHFGISHTTSTLCLKKSSAEVESQVLQNQLELSAQLGDGSTVVLTDPPMDN